MELSSTQKLAETEPDTRVHAVNQVNSVNIGESQIKRPRLGSNQNVDSIPCHNTVCPERAGHRIPLELDALFDSRNVVDCTFLAELAAYTLARTKRRYCCLPQANYFDTAEIANLRPVRWLDTSHGDRIVVTYQCWVWGKN